jgi:ABC-type arginine transport system ATPase subunit
MSNPRKIRFAKYDTIGDPSAESDADFLSACFVDNGSLERLRTCDDHRGILLGRTGAGKTALLRRLAETEERVVVLDPHDIALRHLADSTIIRFFESLGVNMDLFYQALWRHVFVVELIKLRFGLDSEDAKLQAVEQMRLRFLRKSQTPSRPGVSQ